MRRFVVYWLPALAWAGVIFLLSSLPDTGAPTWEIPHIDKVSHAAVFAILALLIFRAARQGHGISPRRAAVWAIALASLYGVIDEFHQSFTPNREVDPLDWVADTAGAIVATMLASRSRANPRCE